MYYINKIVGWVMSPIGMLFLGVAIGIGCLGFKSNVLRLKALGKWVIGITLCGFWFLGTGIATRFIGVTLEGEEAPEIGTLQVGGYDAVVCLGGGIGKHAKCARTELFSGADRAWEAAKVWKAYASKVKDDGDEWDMPLICTGKGCAEATIPLLKDLGVPREAIVGFEEPRNTEEEAALIKEKLAHHSLSSDFTSGKPKILLVTSAWHMPRAKKLFERAGLEVVARCCDYEMHYVAEKEVEFGDFFPNADSLSRNSYALKEWVARIGYAIFK